MAKKCYKVDYVNCAGTAGSVFVCSESIQIVAGGNCGGIYFSSADLGYNANNASEISGSLTIVSGSNCGGCGGGVDPNKPCDCINGGCVPATTYGTPGVFPNLAACQSGCAKNSNCTGECVSPEEMAALQQAANNLRGRLCG